MNRVVDSGRIDHRWLWVPSMLLGVSLLFHTSDLQSGFVSTWQVTGRLPALLCRIPAQAVAPEIKAVSADIARRFHVAESSALGITHAAFSAARARGINPMLVLAVAAVESRFKAQALNPVTGARGLMQVMPRWHPDKVFNVGGEPSLFLIAPNIDVGAAILAEYLEREDGNVENALSRYLGTVGGDHYSRRVHFEMQHLTRVAEKL